MSQKFADKNSTMKAIKFLEKQIKKLMDKVSGQECEDDDPMFTKKHLCGLSCACCEKDLKDI